MPIAKWTGQSQEADTLSQMNKSGPQEPVTQKQFSAAMDTLLSAVNGLSQRIEGTAQVMENTVPDMRLRIKSWPVLKKCERNWRNSFNREYFGGDKTRDAH
ncbi:hypothetical protein MMC27_008012 [Xylographa pallens]|nr:hypothetical protein [Xylographa pallens]